MGRVPFHWSPLAFAQLVGIEPYEVMQVLQGKRPRWPVRKVHPAGLRVLEIWGRTQTGRGLVVITREVRGSRFDYQILGAREMTAVEAAQYDEWEASRG
jgi:hypothetical protein